MADLVNSFSLSNSQIENFLSCPRKYWFGRYGSWGGWEKTAPERTREIYRLKNLSNVYLWTGDRVHSTIRTIVETFLEKGLVLDKENVKENLSKQFDTEFAQSKDSYDPKTFDKKSFRLIEHDDPKKAFDEDRLNDVLCRALRCIDGFYASDIARFIFDKKVEVVRKDDVLESYSLPIGRTDIPYVPVYITIDLLLKNPATGNYLVVDWKTGKPSKTHNDQLALYALFVSDKFKVPAEKIKIAPLYLAYMPDTLDLTTVTAKDVETEKNSLIYHSNEILQLIDDPVKGIANEERFSKKPTRFGCSNCVYERVCTP